MKDCAHIVPLIGAREGELTSDERATRDAHLAGCAACRAREAEAQALGALVREGLMAKANARDFAPFVDGVMERIHGTNPLSPRAAPARARTVRAGGEGEGEGGPVTLEWLGAHWHATPRPRSGRPHPFLCTFRLKPSPP